MSHRITPSVRPHGTNFAPTSSYICRIKFQLVGV